MIDISVISVATPMISYRALIIGSTGSSTRIREERRLEVVKPGLMYSEKLACMLEGGSGDRDRDVEREL